MKIFVLFFTLFSFVPPSFAGLVVSQQGTVSDQFVCNDSGNSSGGGTVLTDTKSLIQLHAEVTGAGSLEYSSFKKAGVSSDYTVPPSGFTVRCIAVGYQNDSSPQNLQIGCATSGVGFSSLAAPSGMQVFKRYGADIGANGDLNSKRSEYVKLPSGCIPYFHHNANSGTGSIELWGYEK